MNGNDGRGSGAGGRRRRGRGRGRGRGGGGRGNNQNRPTQGGGRGWDSPQRWSPHHPTAQQQMVNRPQVQGNQPPAQQAWWPQQTPPPQQPHQQGVGPAAGRPGAWTGRPWGSSSLAASPAQSLSPTQTPPKPSPGFECSICISASWYGKELKVHVSRSYDGDRVFGSIRLLFIKIIIKIITTMLENVKTFFV